MILTKLSLQKISDTPELNGKMPSHHVIACDDKYQHKTRVGTMWLKSGNWGNYLSGELNKAPRTYKNKEGVDITEESYVIITRKEYDTLKGAPSKEETGEANIDDIPF